MEPVTLPTIAGKVDRDVDKSFKRLKDRLNEVTALVVQMQGQQAATPQRTLTLEEIQAALSANGSHPLNLTGLQGAPAVVMTSPNDPGGGGGGGGGGGCGETAITNHLANVELARANYVAGGGDFSTPASVLQIAIAVATGLAGEGCGLLEKTSGENIAPYGSTSVSFSRVMYPGGASIKILIAAGLAGEPGVTNTPGWNFDDCVETSRFVPI